MKGRYTLTQAQVHDGHVSSPGQERSGRRRGGGSERPARVLQDRHPPARSSDRLLHGLCSGHGLVSQVKPAVRGHKHGQGALSVRSHHVQQGYHARSRQDTAQGGPRRSVPVRCSRRLLSGVACLTRYRYVDQRQPHGQSSKKRQAIKDRQGAATKRPMQPKQGPESTNSETFGTPMQARCARRVY